jgi:hypothetical protein
MRYILNKGFVITILLTMFFSFATGASFGIKAGMNIANMHGDDIGGTQSKIGFIGGGFATFGLGDVFAIQPEILYSQKGYRFEQWYMGALYRETGMLYYIEIPMLSKITIQAKGNIKPNFFIGPYFGINLTAKKRIQAIEPPHEEDIENFRDTEFGMVFGGGVDFVGVRGKVGFEGRYTFGLTTTSEFWDDIKNDVISFMLSYSF